MDKNESTYNPFEDKSIHLTQQDDTSISHNREGFNDVIKHYDIINGHMIPKRIDHFPQKIRRVLRLLIKLWVLGTVLLIAFSFIRNIFKIIE